MLAGTEGTTAGIGGPAGLPFVAATPQRVEAIETAERSKRQSDRNGRALENGGALAPAGPRDPGEPESREDYSWPRRGECDHQSDSG